MKVSTLEIYKRLEKKLGTEDAEFLLNYIGEKTEDAMNEVKQDVLTQKDKIDIINRMDAHFKWLVGITLTAISLATILAKLL